MATALDLLMSTKEDVNLLSEESDICTIDAKTRVIFVPSTIVVGGVQSDKNAERIKFLCPKIVGDNLDLSKFSIRINFENVSSVDFNVSIKDQYICDDVAVDGENVTFSWLIGRNAARYMGTVRFIVCAVKTDSDSNISVEWNTTIAEVPVLEGIEIDQPQIGQEEKDVINQLLELTKNTSAEAIQNVNSAKEQAIKDIQSVSQPDTTLTIEGGLAEAKATGEAIGSLKENKVDKPSAADDGKIPRAKEGEVEWVEVGQPTDEQTNSAVSSWLNEHPEATTTVQDGSLDEKKIQASFRKKIKRTYRTFQDVLNDNFLETGTYIETTGFYSTDDGGGGLYLVSTYAPSDGNPCYFSYFDKYIVYIAKENVCNALALGIKKDGSLDCSDIVNKFFASKQVESKRYYSLYFPAGVYLFTNPIKIENTVAYANISGCASSRGTYAYVHNDNFYPKYSATVFAFDIPKNTTAMTVNIETDGSFNMNGITFVSNSSLFKSEGFETRPTVPYNVFSIEKKVENVNGLNIENCRRTSVENCSFIGFSGYGLRSYSHNILNCFFSDCSVGVENNKSDLMLFNCYIARCENGIKAGSGGVIWASNTFIDQCVMHGILSENQPQTTLVVNGCVIDHIGYSGICVEYALDANIDARIGRCGMYYAGKTTGFSDMLKDEKKKATTIYYGQLLHGNFRLNIYKRSITDDSTNLDYVLPNVVFGGTYKNVVVTGLHYKDYLLFCNEENVHNTTIYADDGIHTYS